MITDAEVIAALRTALAEAWRLYHQYEEQEINSVAGDEVERILAGAGDALARLDEREKQQGFVSRSRGGAEKDS